MKQDTKNPNPVLNGAKLEFFYGILSLWESGEENKVIKNFKTKEIKRFLARRDSNGVIILFLSTDKNKKCENCKYKLYINDTKNNIGLSLLYHLRNAFAHNDIQLSDQDRLININLVWKGVLKLKTKIPFIVLKELIETIRGQHNLTSEEPKKNKHKKQKSK